MISIIVCSADESKYQELCENIRQTAGAPFEIIRIDNSSNEYGICDAYNKGATFSNFEILCFIHEDIEFVTGNWCKILLEIFEDPGIGLVGIAGACYYSLAPIGWFSTAEIETNYIQYFKKIDLPPVHRQHSRFHSETNADVAVIDGVFMATRKEIVKKHPFDSHRLARFHGYDIDFSLQVKNTTRIVMTKRILIKHFSEGSLDRNWYDTMQIIARKWERQLPAFIPAYTGAEIKRLKVDSLNIFFFFSSRYFNRIKRTRLYFYYAMKQGILLLAFKYFCIYSFQRVFKNKGK